MSENTKTQEESLVPRFYVNAFNCGLAPSDIRVHLRVDQDVVADLNLNIFTAKELVMALTHNIEKFEKISNCSVLPYNELSRNLKNLNEDSSE